MQPREPRSSRLDSAPCEFDLEGGRTTLNGESAQTDDDVVISRAEVRMLRKFTVLAAIGGCLCTGAASASYDTLTVDPQPM